MMPFRTPQEEARRTARLKHAITIVFIAINGCGEKVDTDTVMKAIETECGDDRELANLANIVLASVMMGAAKSKSAEIERQAAI